MTAGLRPAIAPTAPNISYSHSPASPPRYGPGQHNSKTSDLHPLDTLFRTAVTFYVPMKLSTNILTFPRLGIFVRAAVIVGMGASELFRVFRFVLLP